MPVTEFTEHESRAIRDKWSLPRFVYWVPFGMAAMTCLLLSWPTDHWAFQAACMAVLAYAYFCWTSCFHECAHMTLTSSKLINLLLGRVLGTVMLTPYTAYRETHIRHHAYLNKPNDWELWPYSDPTTSRSFRRAFVWLDLFFGVFTSAFIYGRIFWHRDSPLQGKAVRLSIVLEYLRIVVFWGVTLSLVTYYQQWPMFLKVWLIPYWVAGMIQSGRKLTEHLGMASYDPLLGTRTVIGDNPITKGFTFVNFDIFVHGLHHRHPRMAHDRLADKMTEYVANEPDRRWPVYGTYGRALADMLPHLWRNPGVGMNVGAPNPDPGTAAEVENFASDVASEVLAPEDSEAAAS